MKLNFFIQKLRLVDTAIYTKNIGEDSGQYLSDERNGIVLMMIEKKKAIFFNKI